MFCHVCGKENQEGSAFCTSCGANLNNNQTQPVNQNQNFQNQNFQNQTYQNPNQNFQTNVGYNPPVQSKFSGLAIASFVVSLVGIFLFALPCGVIATSLSASSFKQINTYGNRGKALAISGLIIGIVDIVFGIVNILTAK